MLSRKLHADFQLEQMEVAQERAFERLYKWVYQKRLHSQVAWSTDPVLELMTMFSQVELTENVVIESAICHRVKFSQCAQY